ncbi:MAG: SpoIIE family protein phosphatase [Pseudomonadota bacterium]
MTKRSGLARKLIIWLLTCISLVFVVVFGYTYYFSKEIILNRVASEARHLAGATVNRLDSVLFSVQNVPIDIAAVLSEMPADARTMDDLLRTIVAEHKEIYGMAVAFEPFAFDPDIERYTTYAYRRNGELVITDIPYNYFSQDWYQIPKMLDEAVWSEPYFDEGAGDIVMSTFSVPFYRKRADGREMIGIVTADISLEWLKDIVASIKIADTGYGFLVTKNGTFVTHPHIGFIQNETLFSVAEAKGDPRIREIGRSMIAGETGFVPFDSLLTGKACWLAYAPLASSGWSLGVLFPRSELMADADRLGRTAVLMFMAGLTLLCALIIWLARSITRPLRTLASATADIAEGNLDHDIPPIRSNDEVGQLAAAFSHMITSLKGHIEALTAATAARERIESELSIARDIQMGILPKVFPPFPERPEIELYATIEPAKEVGGDFYDFFFIDDDHLCLALGDVSGKGIPASLFMAVTRTLVKTKATQGLTPETILGRVNEDLSIENPSQMFVTLFLAILNVNTGRLAFCNGGHNPPYIVTEDGAVTALPLTDGCALGIIMPFDYTSREVIMEKNDVLFIYTDGVTEAIDQQEAEFSEGRLESLLADSARSSSEQMVTGVMHAVECFATGMPQADDITIMALRFNGIGAAVPHDTD